MTIIQLTKEEVRRLIKDEVLAALAYKQPCEKDGLMSRRATADYLGVTFPTLRAWEKKGYLQPTRIGSKVYFRKSDLVHNHHQHNPNK